MAASVNTQSAGRTVPGWGGALFALMVAAIAAAFIAGGCGGKASAKAGQTAEKPSTAILNVKADVSWYSAGEDEFTINTAEELAGLAKLVNEDNRSFEGKIIRLGRDIVINDTANWRDWANDPPARQWTGIGTDEDRFHGTFDGNGRTVSGVYIKNSGMNQGLFGVIGDRGKVKRLNVTASYIEGGNYAGVLVGWTTGVISECYTSGIVIGDSIAGGLAGGNDGLINNSHAAGSVKGRVNAGGFMGANRGGAAAGSHSSASVSGDSVTGGFVGVNWGGTISGNISTGKAAGSAGGFAGRNNGAMRDNYYDRETSGQSDSGKGEGKTTAEMQSAELVDNLNAIAGILSINAWTRSDGGYPSLSDKPADPVSIDGCFASGKGVEDDPYVISAKEHLENLSMLVNSGLSFADKHLKLGRDIALNDTSGWQKWAASPPARVWTPVGIPTNPFDGTLDGGGHAISGVYVNMPEVHIVGLFRKTSGNATIRNLGITASYIRGHCSAGGLVGYNQGRIIDSYSAAIVAAEEFQAGGLAGISSGWIFGCYATGAVSGSQTVGGLVGGNVLVVSLEGDNYGGRIRNSYSTGAVSMIGNDRCDNSGNCEGIGGLVGFNRRGIINACYTVSAVKGDGGKYVGPLVGWNYFGSVRHNFFNSETGGVEDNDIGSGRTTEQMKQKRTFDGWDFRTVWAMDSAVNNGYPRLKPREAAGMSETIRENTGWYSASARKFTISTAGELAAFAEIVNGTWGGTPKRDDFAGKTVRLAQNIDLAAYGNWTPIGSIESIGDDDDLDKSNCPAFSGTFDGGGFVISNLTIDRIAVLYHGLFGKIKSAAVKNLGLENVNIRGSGFVGAVAGNMGFGSSVNNCYSTGAVSGDDNVGGLVGWTGGNCFITNSYSAANVSGSARNSTNSRRDWGDYAVGGVVGYIQYYSMIKNCYSTGAVSGVDIAGGIAGMNPSSRSSIRGCAALNPEIKGSRIVNRVIASSDGVNRSSPLSNNAAYAGMEISDGIGEEDIEGFRSSGDGGADLTAHEIHADPTLGGRFKKADGWTTEKGRLPGLFGKAVEMPPHLAAAGDILAPKAKAADNRASGSSSDDKGTDDGKQVQKSDRLKKQLSDLPRGATLTGSRTRASVQRVIVTEHRTALQQFYKWFREDKPELSGTVAVRFTIDGSGKVTYAKLEKSTVSDAELENAVILRIRHTDFGQAGKPGGATKVMYPFTFGIEEMGDGDEDDDD